jgi:hypothetical protein
MLSWVKEFDENRIKDVLEVVVPNGVVLAAINLSQINLGLQIGAAALTCGYAVWRWRRDSYVLCHGCRDGHPPARCPYPEHKRPSWCPKNLFARPVNRRRAKRIKAYDHQD